MVRPKDPFWEYVKDLNGRFKCNFCGRDFPGGVPRIKSHFSGVKGRDIDICTKVPADIQAAAYQAIRSPNKKAKTTTISNNLEDSGTISTSSNSFLTMSEIHKKDKSLSRSYELPSCSTLETKFIPGFATEVEEYVKDVKKSWALTGCTLMVDMCMKEQAIMNVIAYSPRGAVFMNSFNISEHQKKGVYLTGIVSSIIEEIGSDHIVQFITSKATIFDSVGNTLKSKYPQICKTRCAACEIQSLLKDIYVKAEWVKAIIDDAKWIVKYMNADATIFSLIRQHTNDRELKRACMTKFVSTYKMLQLIFDNENELQLLFASAEWRALDDNKKEIAEKITDIISNRNFWSRGRELLLVLKPIIHVLCLVEGDGSTLGYLYEAMEWAEAEIKQHCLICSLTSELLEETEDSIFHPIHADVEFVSHVDMWSENFNEDQKMNKTKAFACSLILELLERRRNSIIHPIHAAAAFLNPAYMLSENFKDDQKMNQGIGFMLENLVADEEKETFIKEVQIYRMKVSSLFTKTAMAMLKTFHPRLWWDYFGHSLSVLRKHAIRILSQPCISACEQRWSAFEVAQRKKMKRQIVKASENFVHVGVNKMMIEKFNTFDERCLEPIDLKKCNKLPDYVDLEQCWEDDSAKLINKNFDRSVMNEANPFCSDGQVLLKVFKSGHVGRYIDITRYKGYDELRHDLAVMFGIEGQLEDPQNSDWSIVYVDHEKDKILVGLEPWDLFVCCAQSIQILSSVEVEQMNFEGDLGNASVPNQARSGTDSEKALRGQYDETLDYHCHVLLDGLSKPI